MEEAKLPKVCSLRVSLTELRIQSGESTFPRKDNILNVFWNSHLSGGTGLAS